MQIGQKRRAFGRCARQPILKDCRTLSAAAICLVFAPQKVGINDRLQCRAWNARIGKGVFQHILNRAVEMNACQSPCPDHRAGIIGNHGHDIRRCRRPMQEPQRSVLAHIQGEFLQVFDHFRIAARFGFKH